MKLIYTLFFCCLAVTAQAQDWPSFRGLQASGVADGRTLPDKWDAEKQINVQWKTPIPGLAHASPIVWGNRIFLTTAISQAERLTYVPKDRGIDLANDNAKHTWRIYCLEKTSGRVLWERTAHEGIPRAKRHIKATQANATPVTDGKYVVALMGSEGMFAYDFKGKLLWKRDLGILNPGLNDDPKSEWGHAASLIIHKNLVIVQCDGHQQSFIAAFNLKDGQQVWRVERGEITSWSTPAIYAGKDRAELIANGGKFIRGYDPMTGKELWRFAQNNVEVKQQVPLQAHGLIYLTGGYPPGSPMYAFRPGANGDISLKEGEEKNQFLAWRASKGSPYTPTPIVYGEYLYVCADNGVFSAYQAKTGELIYQERLPSSFSASPVAGDGKLFLSSEDGDVFVIKAGAKFERLAINPMGEALMGTPAISDGVILLRGQHHLFAVTQKQAAFPQSGTFVAPSTVKGSDAVAGKTTGTFFALSVADVVTLSRWYQEKLGFRVISQGEAPDKIAKFALLEGDGSIIELIQHSEGKPRRMAAPMTTEAYQIHGIFKVGMVVSDLDSLYRELTQRDVPIAYDMRKARDFPMRSFSVRDGEGNLVQFFGK
jgi:outer membrane protein assembly factor BamB